MGRSVNHGLWGAPFSAELGAHKLGGEGVHQPVETFCYLVAIFWGQRRLQRHETQLSKSKGNKGTSPENIQRRKVQLSVENGLPVHRGRPAEEDQEAEQDGVIVSCK